MFFLVNSVEQHPSLIVLEGETAILHIEKLNKNPINFPHLLGLWADPKGSENSETL